MKKRYSHFGEALQGMSHVSRIASRSFKLSLADVIEMNKIALDPFDGGFVSNNLPLKIFEELVR